MSNANEILNNILITTNEFIDAKNCNKYAVSNEKFVNNTTYELNMIKLWAIQS